MGFSQLIISEGMIDEEEMMAYMAITQLFGVKWPMGVIENKSYVKTKLTSLS